MPATSEEDRLYLKLLVAITDSPCPPRSHWDYLPFLNGVGLDKVWVSGMPVLKGPPTDDI